jgi:hypothetical protein
MCLCSACAACLLRSRSCPRQAGNVGELRPGGCMARDLLGRPPLRASELPPNQVMLYPGEPRAVVCPGCGRWLVPHDGGLRRHATGVFSTRTCPETGRRVWFDISAAQWAAELAVAVREAALRRGSTVHHGARAPVAPPVHRLSRH